MKKYKEKFKVLKPRTILLNKDIRRMPIIIDDLTGQIEIPKIWNMKKKTAEKELRKYKLVHSV